MAEVHVVEEQCQMQSNKAYNIHLNAETSFKRSCIPPANTVRHCGKTKTKKQANKQRKPTGLNVDIVVRSNAWELKTSYVLTYLWGGGLLKLSEEHLFDFKVSSTTQGHTRMRDMGGWVVREGGGVG